MSLTPSLDRKVVVLTGAGGRLGRVVAAKLIAAGARVAGLDAQPTEDLPEGVFFQVADLADETAVESAFSEVIDRFGAVDGVVHTVGMWGGAPFAETTLSEWETMLNVNLRTTFLVFREAARRMSTNNGRLVAIASKQGADGGVAEQGPYSAGKAGVVRLVESIAAEYDGRITASAVAPSMILFGDESADAQGVSVDAIADLCVYLCGDGGTIHNGEVLRAYGTMI
ncbi:MAG: SDR family NAD(P)-dependent oxidoreductase [Rubricoccaceae bacterium]|nr:SDR family NAD(P)-dependent oxidoreductase [Rubricoccaceae bacterium]